MSASDVEELESAYGGKYCIVLGVDMDCHWCHIIPPASPTQEYLIGRMAHLGLIPSSMHATSFLNIIPLATWHAAFDSLMWTFYPEEASLLRHIQIEEDSLLGREMALATTGCDPGRQTYEQAYLAAHKMTTFDVYFGEDFTQPVAARMPPNQTPQLFRTYPRKSNAHFPPFPSISLAASVNIVIRMRTGAMCSYISLSDAGKRQRQLGLYLIKLWDAIPAQFRKIRRPHALIPLPLPPDRALSRPRAIRGTTVLLSSAPPDLPTQFRALKSSSTCVETCDILGVRSLCKELSHAMPPTLPPSPKLPIFPRTGSLLSTFYSAYHTGIEIGQSAEPRPTSSLAAISHWLADIENGKADPPVVSGLDAGALAVPRPGGGKCGGFTSNQWAAAFYGLQLSGDVWSETVCM